MSAEPDELRTLRSHYFLGQYDAAIAEARNLSASAAAGSSLAEHVLVYHFRALAELNPAAVLENIPANERTALQAVRLYASFKAADAADLAAREGVMEKLEAWLADPDLARDPTLQIVAAHLFLQMGNYREALRWASAAEGAGGAPRLEKLALEVQVLLAMGRPDLALPKAKTMQEMDDDDALAQLATAWCGMVSKEPALVAEALSLLQELTEKMGPSVSLLNASAACTMMQGRYKEAFQLLKQARDMCIKAQIKVHPDVFINSMVCLHHHGQPSSDEVVAKILAEFRVQHPHHAFFQKQQQVEADFDRIAAQYASTITPSSVVSPSAASASSSSSSSSSTVPS